MPSFSLDEINEAAEARYGPFVVTGIPGGDVTLLNPLRMGKAKRTALAKLQKNTGADDDQDVDSALDRLHEMVLTAAKTKADGERLLKALGDDQAKLVVLLNEYGKTSRPGEATPSPS